MLSMKLYFTLLFGTLSLVASAQVPRNVPLGPSRTIDTTSFVSNMIVDGDVKLSSYPSDSTKALFTDASGNLFSATVVTPDVVTDSLNSVHLQRVTGATFDSTTAKIKASVFHGGNTPSNDIIPNVDGAFVARVNKTNPDKFVVAGVSSTVALDRDTAVAGSLLSGSFLSIIDSDNTVNWIPNIADHPEVTGVAASVSARTGATGTIPFVASFYATLGGVSTLTYEEAALIDLTFAHTATIGRSYGIKLTDPDAGTHNTAIWIDIGNENQSYPGNWSLADATGYRAYIEGELNIGDTIDKGAYKLQVAGKEITTGLDEYSANLASTYTARTKPDKGYVDSNINARIAAVPVVDTSSLSTRIETKWSKAGNSIAQGDFLGTTNSADLVFKANNQEGFIVDSLNGFIGIGTRTPSQSIHIRRDVNGSTPQLFIENYDVGTGASGGINLRNVASGSVAGIFLRGVNYAANGWADKLTITTGSGIDGGIAMNAVTGGITLSTSSLTANDFKVATTTGAVLINTGTGNSIDKLQVNGTATFMGYSVAVSSVKTANYTVTNSDYFIPVDATATLVDITLPTTGITTGRVFQIKKIAGGNAVTAIGTIDGAANLAIGLNKTYTLVWNGTDYYIAGSN